jgi:hypothetical protein
LDQALRSRPVARRIPAALTAEPSTAQEAATTLPQDPSPPPLMEFDMPSKFRPTPWVKASTSIGANACIEVAKRGELIMLRDSKNPNEPPFIFTIPELAAFVDAAKNGEFDQLLEESQSQPTGIGSEARDSSPRSEQ